MTQPNVITIDGPAASGKSSVALMLAEKLGIVFVNSGNMYRAATLVALHAGVDVHDPAAVAQVVNEARFTWTIEHGRSVIRVNDREVEHELTSGTVNKAVSPVAAVPEVRQKMTAIQREIAMQHPIVMEGRDIGTVVFPDAPHKFYISASEEVRARRRGLQGHTDSVKDRDRQDSTRKVAPLKTAADAIEIDSSHLTLDQVLHTVLEHLGKRGVQIPNN